MLELALDVKRIVELGSKMGLVLNAATCELVAHSGLVVDDPLLQSFTRVEPGDATLLGAPLFPGKVLTGVWTFPEQWTACASSVPRMY